MLVHGSKLASMQQTKRQRQQPGSARLLLPSAANTMHGVETGAALSPRSIGSAHTSSSTSAACSSSSLCMRQDAHQSGGKALP